MSLEIIVTHEHIARGRRGDAEMCAVSQSLRDAGYHDVLVHADVVWIGEDSYATTDELREWIFAFDANAESVHPERFVLEPASVPATVSLVATNSPAA